MSREISELLHSVLLDLETVGVVLVWSSRILSPDINGISSFLYDMTKLIQFLLVFFQFIIICLLFNINFIKPTSVTSTICCTSQIENSKGIFLELFNSVLRRKPIL